MPEGLGHMLVKFSRSSSGEVGVGGGGAVEGRSRKDESSASERAERTGGLTWTVSRTPEERREGGRESWSVSVSEGRRRASSSSAFGRATTVALSLARAPARSTISRRTVDHRAGPFEKDL